ncbi:MAG TPA: hypothetical protein VNA16_10175 [Abditibacteriaceae bacterium]|nr:hypothetical protein [Abditibacteriaceae bacterium]
MKLIPNRQNQRRGLPRAIQYYFLYSVLVLSAARVPAAPALEKPQQTTPMAEYLTFVLQSCDRVEKRIPEISAIAETVAERHSAGGMFGVIWEPPKASGPQGTQYEIRGRSGGMSALDANIKKNLTLASRDKDIAVIGWQRAPEPGELEIFKQYREKYTIVALGPRELPALAEFVKLADIWIDTGLGADDGVLTLPDGSRAGRGNHLLNLLHSWALVGEVVAALTRKGKMPTMLKSHAWPDAKDWNGRYRGKLLFHDDIQIKPIPAGTLTRRYLDQIRDLARRFGQAQEAAVKKTAQLIVAELGQGRKTLVTKQGHTIHEYVGQYEDSVWAVPRVLEAGTGRLAQHLIATPDKALVLHVGYTGSHPNVAEALRKKQQRVMLITTRDDPRPEMQLPDDLLTVIDMGWAFGDACVEIDGYPIRVFPPSGVMQLVAYEAVNVEVLALLAKPAKPGA